MKSLASLFSNNFHAFDNEVIPIPSGLDYLDLFITGIPRGKFSLLVGLEGSGKTTLMLQMALSFLKSVNNSVVLLYDTEHAIGKERLKALKYPPEFFDRIFTPDTEVLTIEGMFNTLEKEINTIRVSKNDIPILILWDSIAQTPPEAEMEGKIGDSEMGLRARLLSQIFRKYMSLFDAADITLIAVNQLRYKMNTAPFEDPYVSPCGKAPEYAAWLWLDLRRSKNFEHINNARIVDVRLRKNKFSPPIRFNMILNPNTGFSDAFSVYQYLLDNSKIKELGRGMASLKLSDLSIEKFNICKEWEKIYTDNKEVLLNWIKSSIYE